jgi:hypothetical protein
MSPQHYVAYIGIDWADRKHDIALCDFGSGTWQESVIQASVIRALNEDAQSMRQGTARVGE